MQNNPKKIPLFELHPLDPASQAAPPSPQSASSPLTGIDYVDPAGNDVAPAEPSKEELLEAARIAAEQKQEQERIEQEINAIVQRANSTPEQLEAQLLKVKAANNPLHQAAKPLIWMLADMRKTDFTTHIQIESFRRLLHQEIINFSVLCNRADILREHRTAASYFLCTALDEFACGTKWGGSQGAGDPGAWAGGGMLAAKFHQNSKGGENFFSMAAGIAAKPELHRHLLEVQYYILSLGFKGMYREDPDGDKKCHQICQGMYDILYANQPSVPAALSPNLMPVVPGKFMPMRHIPVGLVAAVAVVAALSMFGWYKYELLTQSEQLVQEIADIGKMTPPPALSMPLHLLPLLKADIASGKVAVDESEARKSRLLFKGDDLFAAGAATLRDDMLPLLNKVGAEMAKASGRVQVIGHSDNVPIQTRAFPNNQALSEERAANVGDVLRAAGVASNRLDIIGRGDSEPVASNASAAGRAANRRVEIIASQGDLDTPVRATDAPSNSPSVVSSR